MSHINKHSVLPLIVLLLMCLAVPADALYRQQCPPDMDGIDTDGDGIVNNDHVCLQIGSGDGFATMADGYSQYSFGFSRYGGLYNAGGVDTIGSQPDWPADPVPDPGNAGNMWDAGGLILAANTPAPTIAVRQGQSLFLSLHNVGMLMRPDLFDPHTVHYHGFPNVASIFDGLPDSAISINMGSTLTYYYYLAEPGTFMYHCHVEASEHMQMGMLGNFYVTPRQDLGPAVNGFSLFAYNDVVDVGDPGADPRDGATGYDVDYPIQIQSWDPAFHDANENTQPLPFAGMHDVYPMLNGRGYPDTVNTGNILSGDGYDAQDLPALITASVGDSILLRISSLATVEYYTLTSPSIPMKVVGNGAKILRSGGAADGTDLSYTTNSIRLGGGESMDVILDTNGLDAGTYFLYSRNLHQLSNNQEDFGGMMTEIVIQ
jgi:FtsP/CotA-like multicopper oxidase with cupredoxin domain